MSTVNGTTFEAAAAAIIRGNLGYNLGPYIIAAFFEALFCGLLICQFNQWITFAKIDKDSRILKVLSIYALLISLANTGATIAFVLHLFASGFGTYSNFLQDDWVSWYPIRVILVAVPIQCFFTHKASHLNGKSNAVFGVAVIIMALSVAGVLGARIVSKVPSPIVQTSTFEYIWMSSTFAVNLFLTALIIYGRSKAKKTVNSSQPILKVLEYCVEISLFPTVFSFALLTSFASGADPIATFFMILQTKIYVTVYLGALNFRYALQMVSQTESQTKSNNFAHSGRPTQATVHIPDDDYELHESRLQPRTGNTVHYDVKDFIDEDAYDGKLGYENNPSRTGLPQEPRSSIV